MKASAGRCEKLSYPREFAMDNHRVRFVVFRYLHHSKHSGYSRLAEYGVTRFRGQVIPVDKPLPRTIIRERMLRRLASGTPGYDRAAMSAELKVAWRIFNESDFIYHFLYGETTYRYASYLNNLRNNRLVATFHQPPSNLPKVVHIDWHIRRLSAIICVGRNQKEYFAEFFNPERIFFIPLGVDTQYFTPPDSFDTRSQNLCLVVGTNFRDLPTLRGVIELVVYLRPETKFVVVTPSHNFTSLGQHPNLILRADISEPELRELYRSAALMVMPLKDATANNSILECMACGLPLIVSDVGAVRDYVYPEGAQMVPTNDSRKMAEAVIKLLDEPRVRQRMSASARQQSLKFAWPKVVEQLDSVYRLVA